jgi:hypothetical protein
MSDAAQAVDTAPVDDQEPESIFDGVEVPQQEPVNEIDTPTNPEARPDWLPEKFKTPDDLVKAYNEMGSKIRQKFEPPEQYEIKLGEEAVELTESDVAMFKETGLTNEQAQKLTEYFHESIVPALQEARVSLELDRLADAWGTPANSNEFKQQLASVKAWAQQNLPESVVAEMSKSSSGVNTLLSLMKQGAQAHRAVGQTQARPTKEDLNRMMQDERYWKGDEEYRNYVREQFRVAFD